MCVRAFGNSYLLLPTAASNLPSCARTHSLTHSLTHLSLIGAFISVHRGTMAGVRVRVEPGTESG